MRKGCERFLLQPLERLMAICMRKGKSPLGLFHVRSLNIQYIITPSLIIFYFLQIFALSVYWIYSLNLCRPGLRIYSRLPLVDQNRFADAWDDIQRPEMSHYQGRTGLTNLTLEQPGFEQDFGGPPQQVLSNLLQLFFRSSHDGMTFRPTSLPHLGLSEGDKQCIRDRNSIMARHLFSDKREELVHEQLARLFSEAAKLSPDVHIVLGVMCNLSREYDKGIEYFQTALKLKARDYSLWNKLGSS